VIAVIISDCYCVFIAIDRHLIAVRSDRHLVAT